MTVPRSLKIAKLFGAASMLFFFAVLFFRFAVYRHMYLAPDEPYGLSDIVEFLLGSALMLVVGASALFALVLAVRGPRENRVAAAWLFFTCAAIGLLLDPLHTLAARWAI